MSHFFINMHISLPFASLVQLHAYSRELGIFVGRNMWIVHNIPILCEKTKRVQVYDFVNGRSNYLAMAIVISSFAKLMHILMVIWDYNDFRYSWLINLFVYTSNVESIGSNLNFHDSFGGK